MLEQRHRAELHASGLTDETIEAAGIASDDGKRIRKILGNPPKSLRGWGPGYIIPFRRFGATEPDFFRVKLDHPRTNGTGRIVKYEQPIGKANRAYFPPGFEESSQDATTFIVAEGEKKALAGQQAGFPTVGITGVWNFQARRLKTDTGRAYGPRELIPDLQDVPWKEKRVVIAHDSDSVRNDSVRMAEAKFAECLKKSGADDIRVARIPEDGDSKVGLDDFLQAHGVDALRQVIARAEPAEEPPTPKVMDWARMILDEQFTATTDSTLRWWRDEFYVYRARHYAIVPDTELGNTTLVWLDKRRENATPRLSSDVVKCMGALCRVPFDMDMPAFLDRRHDDPSRVIAFQNGLLDLSDLNEMKLQPHTPAWFSTSCLPYDYDPNAACPQWLAFLRESLCEEDKADLLQEWMGLLLTHDTSFQKLLMMVGPKRSGKGTILRVIQHVVGPENVVSPSLGGLGTEFGLWPLLGKTVCMFPDAHIGHRTDSVRVLEMLKSVVGEDSVSVNRKNLPYLPNVRLNTRFIITANELPRFSDASDALGARLCLLQFEHSFAERMDRGLEAKLKAEASGILLWGLAGLHRLMERGEFTVPAASEELLAGYRRMTSPVTGFAEDYCEAGPGLACSCDRMFAAWCGWCAENGNKAGASATFGEHLLAALPQLRRRRRRRKGGGREYFYDGIGLNTLGSIAANRKAECRDRHDKQDDPPIGPGVPSCP